MKFAFHQEADFRKSITEQQSFLNGKMDTSLNTLSTSLVVNTLQCFLVRVWK